MCGAALLLLAIAYGLGATFGGKPVAAPLGIIMCVPAALLARAFWNRDDRRGLMLLLVLAVLVRVPFLASVPLWSNDAYRYVWDGRLALRGVDPRAVTPLDPSLAAERKSALWPFIDLREIPTVYPPLAIEVFAAEALLDRDGVRGAKAVAEVADFAVISALLIALWRRGIARGRVALYALHPVVLVSFAQEAHIEAFAIVGIVVALFAKTGLRVAALAGAILMKLYPAILLPLFAVRERTVALATIAVVAVAYAPALLGGHAAGSLRDYLTAQGFNASIALLGPIPSAAIFLGTFAVLVILMHRGLALSAAALAIVTTYLLCTPNVLPWYLTVIPALVALQKAPFDGRFAALTLGVVVWSATVALAYAVPWLLLPGSALEVSVRLVEYAPIVAGAVVTACARTSFRLARS